MELAAGAPSSAVAPALESVTGWAGLEAPYEEAVARLVLGEAYAAVSSTERGRMEWVVALEAFERFGASRMADRARLLLLGGPSTPVTALRVATEATFVRHPLRHIGFGGRRVTVPDLKGYRYLERLLADPGREWHVLDLVAAERGNASAPLEAGMPALDDDAREAYRRRLVEVEQDIDEATLMNGLGRVELAQRDRDFLVAELVGAVGLHGQQRLVHGSSERARTSVLRCLRYAVAHLAEHHADLAAQVQGTVRTGTYCS